MLRNGTDYINGYMGTKWTSYRRERVKWKTKVNKQRRWIAKRKATEEEKKENMNIWRYEGEEVKSIRMYRAVKYVMVCKEKSSLKKRKKKSRSEWVWKGKAKEKKANETRHQYMKEKTEWASNMYVYEEKKRLWKRKEVIKRQRR